MPNGPESGVISPRQFRDVLGNFPTGVAVITSIGDDGQPIGMAVGSFTSVSLDPPLVAFLPDRGSATFAAIRDAGKGVGVRGRPSAAVRAAEAAREDLEKLAEVVGLECRVVALEDDGLVIVATAGHAAGADPVGAVVPFHPPFGSTIAAWGSPELRTEWYDRFPVELDGDQRAKMQTWTGYASAAWH